MRARLGILLFTTVTSAYSSASEVVTLDEVTVLGEVEGQIGYVNQFEQPTTTGSKLGLTIKETPASVEVINTETMQERGDTTVIRAVTKAAGITGGSSGHGTTGNYSARGFTGYPGIDFLQDGIKLNGTIFSKRTLDVSNLDRIEVIRGASSVLNGEGSVGATVNLITKKPSLTTEETELGFKAGSLDSYRFNLGNAGIIVDDKLAYRVDMVTRQIGSNYDGEGRELASLSTSFLYKINDDLITSLSFEKTKDDWRTIIKGRP